MPTVTAEIIAIGDELLYGQIMDTNSHWISQELDARGVRVVRKTTVGDNRKDILEAFEAASQRAHLILITGGLGPTQDDLTKPLLAEYFGCEIVEVPEAVAAVSEYFTRRGREMTRLNILQGHLPTCCTYVPNEVGTAPGMWFEQKGCYWMSMPGVPPLPPHIRLAYLPSLGHVKLRLTAFGENKELLEQEVEQQIQAVLPSISSYVYGYNEETLEAVVGKLLKQAGQTVAVAESCSGGFISHTLTTVPGSSAYFKGAVVPYQNEGKKSILGVKPETLLQYGAVSEQTVREMATGVRSLFGAHIGLASSGIAGPDGGTAEKPVGTVWIACAGEGFVETKKLQLTQDRMINIQLTGVAVLNLLRICISKARQ